jgi:hypothetical protein
MRWIGQDSGEIFEQKYLKQVRACKHVHVKPAQRRNKGSKSTGNGELPVNIKRDQLIYLAAVFFTTATYRSCTTAAYCSLGLYYAHTALGYRRPNGVSAYLDGRLLAPPGGEKAQPLLGSCLWRLVQ